MAIEAVPEEIFRGESVRLDFDLGEDITGWTMELTLSATPGSSALVTKTTASGITIDDAGDGECHATLSAANTTQSPGTYHWCLARTDSGAETVLAYGALILRANTPLG